MVGLVRISQRCCLCGGWCPRRYKSLLQWCATIGALTREKFLVGEKMSEPTLVDVFGAGAVQDANTVTIQKSALASFGLTAQAQNTAESLLVALILQASQNLTEANRALDAATRNVTVTYAGQDLVNQSPNYYRRDLWTVLAYASTSIVTVDPDNY